MLRALLLDDEAPARAVLQHLLAAHCPNVTVVGETADPVEGVALARELRPDLLFLDIEMPRLSGFDVLRALGADARRLGVIFCTAYDRYAIQAIRYAALDYLLKPVDTDELTAAVGRAAAAGATPHDRYDDLLDALQRPAAPTRLTLPTTEGLLVVPVDEILCCEAAGAYTLVHRRSQPRPLTVSRSLKEYDDLLTGAGHQFFRVHHSWLINLVEVRRYIRGEGGSVELTDGRQIDVAKRRKEEFLAALTRV